VKFIEFDHHKCDECYKCLRVCPTKAIKFTDHSRDIINSLCIKCGICQASCPQSALTIQNDRHKIKKQIHLGSKIAVSLAPSFAAAFEDQDPKRIITALRTLGVTWVEETGVAAELVSRNYEAMLETMGTENVLTTCCPSANYLVQHYYPELLDAMLPVVSPMIAHGKLLKEKYGAACYTVFIGPCLAKKAEAEEMPYIDAVLTFNELAEWLEDEGIPYRQLPPGIFDEKATIRGMAYPMGGSLFKNDRQTPIHSGYRMIRADGIDRCKDLLETLKIGGIKNYCIEMNICSGSCINGPDMPYDGLKFFQRKDRMLDYLKAHADHQELDQLLCEKLRRFILQA
jgi:iron only hydrogenase large subunit-like protein